MLNDVEAIYKQHAVADPKIDEWLERAGGVLECVSRVGSPSLMRGDFVPAPSLRFYTWTFVPNKTGCGLAITMPVMELGEMVDIVAFDENDDDRWGCVTNHGRFLNSDALYDSEIQPFAPPIRVETTWFEWLRNDCVGILPLRYDAIPYLIRAKGGLVVNDTSHARQLVYEVYVRGNKTKEYGASRIYVDMEDHQLAAAMASRATREAKLVVTA